MPLWGKSAIGWSYKHRCYVRSPMFYFLSQSMWGVASPTFSIFGQTALFNRLRLCLLLSKCQYFKFVSIKRKKPWPCMQFSDILPATLDRNITLRVYRSILRINFRTFVLAGRSSWQIRIFRLAKEVKYCVHFLFYPGDSNIKKRQIAFYLPNIMENTFFILKLVMYCLIIIDIWFCFKTLHFTSLGMIQEKYVRSL